MGKAHASATNSTSIAGRHDAAAAATSTRRPADDPLALDISQVTLPKRMQMALIARSSQTPLDALDPIVSLLVRGDESKRAAIVKAFSDHPALAGQWERAYQRLRREG